MSIRDRENKTTTIQYRGEDITIAYFIRPGSTTTLVYLHGTGCGKDDFTLALESKDVEENTLVGFDFPGCGDSSYPTDARLTLDDLVEIIKIFLDQLRIFDFVFVGHSSGALLAILYLEKYPARVNGLVNIEGVLNADDCFFAHEIKKYSYDDFVNRGFELVKQKVATKQNKGFHQFLKNLERTNP